MFSQFNSLYSNILSEAPIEVGPVPYISKTHSTIEKKDFGEFVEELDFHGNMVKVYENPGFAYNFAIDDKIVSRFYYESLYGDGIVMDNIWNSPEYRGILRYIIFNFVLKRHKFLQSNAVQTPEGKAFWKKLIATALENKYPVKLNNGEKLLNIRKFSTIEKYWGPTEKFRTLRFRLYGK
jgi:hypothetical protein